MPSSFNSWRAQATDFSHSFNRRPHPVLEVELLRIANLSTYKAKAALTGMEQRDAGIVMLRAVGRTMENTASELQCSPRTVHRIWHEFRRKLAQSECYCHHPQCVLNIEGYLDPWINGDTQFPLDPERVVLGASAIDSPAFDSEVVVPDDGFTLDPRYLDPETNHETIIESHLPYLLTMLADASEGMPKAFRRAQETLARTDAGYLYVRLTNGLIVFLHRLVWSIAYGPIPSGHHIDHIDGNKANNALCNLRLVPAFLDDMDRDLRKALQRC